jgi:hypothetical protein
MELWKTPEEDPACGKFDPRFGRKSRRRGKDPNRGAYLFFCV